MLTIHGVTRSRASRIVWLCHELGLEFRQVPVIQAYRLPDPDAANAPLNTHSPDFVRLSPAGAIPVIEDEGLILSESMACTLHLARKHGTVIGPRDATEDALMLQWSFYAATSIEPDALTILFLHGRAEAPSAPDRALVDNAAERLLRPLKVVSDHLSRDGHMAGGRFTVADINMADVLRYAQDYAPLMDHFPVVARWLKTCQSRPAFRRMWEERLAEVDH